MGVNYTNIGYDTSYPSNVPAICLNDYDGDQVVAGLEVKVSLIGPAGWTPTHYKLWNINGVTTSGAASWESYVNTVTGTLINQSGKQYVYCYFKDATHESSLVTSSGITFSWVDPTIHSSVSWETPFADLGFESASSATLTNSTYNVDLELSKAKINDLLYSGRDLSDIKVQGDTIEASASEYVGSLLGITSSNVVSVTKVFSTDDTPMVWVDTGSGRVTLNKYDGTAKSGLTSGYTGKVSNYSWNSGTKTLTFDANSFSTYGFCTIDKVEFTADSTTAGYNGNSITIKVSVQDTNGEGVESAPVTITKASGDNIGNFSSNPVNTDANGIASFTLNLNAVGDCYYDASVDGVHTLSDQFTRCLDYPAGISRSLLRQYEQIRRTATYDDAIANVNDSSVAEPVTTSGSTIRLEHDTNVLRTLIKQFKGGTNWFDDLGSYFDPTATDSGSAENKAMTFANIKGHTLDAKTILLAVSDDNSGAGFTVSGTDTGVLASITTAYATHADRRGLPIYNSVANTGSYYDEGGTDDVCGVDVIDTSTGGEFKTSGGHLVYAKMYDGADFGGAGTGTDVYFRFFANNNPYTFTGDDPTNIAFVYPHRKVMDEIQEYEWTRTDFVSSFEGDDELIEDIDNLWNYTGAVNNDTAPTWTNTGANYPLTANPTDLEAALNALNDAVDDMTFTEDNYIADGDTVADALDKLDQQIKDNADNISAGIEDVYVEDLVADINAGVEHILPSFLYTPDGTPGQEGSNMDVFLDGQLLAASTGANGVNADRDYAETTTSGITFHMDVYQFSNITYRVRE